jgi:hypothetical protein
LAFPLVVDVLAWEWNEGRRQAGREGGREGGGVRKRKKKRENKNICID